jgi:hypothetical protein
MTFGRSFRVVGVATEGTPILYHTGGARNTRQPGVDGLSSL